DLQMPEMDGFEATAAIRKDERWRGIPIIAITAHVMKGDKQRCINAGMDDYIAKPIDPERLVSTIEKWTGRITGNGLEQVAENQGRKPVDIDGVAERLDGDVEFLREIMQEFLDFAPEQLECIRAGIKSGDAASVERAAHTLKGSAATINAERVRATALRLEEIGRAWNLSAAEATLAQLEAEFRRVQDFLMTDILAQESKR
ncbi:MAG: response regulator, partial [Candidatus Hydrogenedentes bacterium]|nr:response regulator [Candidatus Hydrogenedentota bacterium]